MVMNMKKLSIFLVVCMLVSLFPAGLALAQETSAILRYEIEDSEHNGSAPQGGQNGATGANGGTVLYLSAGGEATLTVDGGVGGEKRIAVRASSGMGNPTQISMAVNGEPVDTKELWPTPGDWLIFRQVFFFANLNPGQNTITLSIAGDGANFDNIEISNKGYLYDFEEADETDPSASAYGHATFSGLGLTPMRASKATFSNVYTQTSGKKKLSITYACGEVGATEMKVTVNGTEMPFLIQPETPLEWWALRTDSFYVQMEAGENNTIVVENVSEGAINADYLTIEDVDEEAEQALVRANVSGVPAFLSAGCSKTITAGDAYRANGEVADCEISYNADGEFLAFDEATGALTALQNGVGSFEVTYTDTLNAQNTLTRQFKINVTNEGQPLFFEAEQMENNGVGLEAGRPLQSLDLGDRIIMMNLNPNDEGTQFYIRNYFSSEAKKIDVTLCFAANDFTFSMETKVNDGEYVPCGLTDTGSWTNYVEKTFQISVEAGFNDITFKGGNYNFDYVFLPGEKYTGGGLTGSDEIKTGATENYSLDAPEGFDAFYTIDSDKVTLSQNADGTASVTSLEKGHDITLTAAVRSSNSGAVETVTKQISTVNAPPAAKTGVSKRVEAKKQITVTAQDLATDADGDALTVTRVVSPGFTQDEAEITVQNGRLIIAGIALTEKKDVTVAVSDQTDETEVTLEVTILAEVINQPPVAKEIPNKNLHVGETYTLNAADLAADPEGETLMITAVSPQSDDITFTDAQITVTAKEKAKKPTRQP